MEATKNYSQVIADLYDGVLQPEGLSKGLDGLRRLFQCENTLLISWDHAVDRITVLGIAGSIPAMTAEYEKEFQFHDPAKESFNRIPKGGWWIDGQVLGDQGIRSSIFHQEFLRRYEIGSYMASPILRGRKPEGGSSPYRELVISFLRELSAGVFTPADTRSLDLVVPHICNAVRLREQVDALSQAAAISQAILDRIGFGVAVIDERLRVLAHNARGELWLRRLGAPSKWSCSSAHLQRPFAEMIAAACGRQPVRVQAANYLAPGELPRQVVVLSLSPPNRFAVSLGSALALVIVHEERSGHDLLAPVLRELYGLSPREILLAESLAIGEDLPTVALRIGVSHETARTQIKAIFQKTGTESRAQLVRLLTTLSYAESPDHAAEL